MYNHQQNDSCLNYLDLSSLKLFGLQINDDSANLFILILVVDIAQNPIAHLLFGLPTQLFVSVGFLSPEVFPHKQTSCPS